MADAFTPNLADAHADRVNSGDRVKGHTPIIEFNHTIVWSRDSKVSATFLSEMLGPCEPRHWGPFEMVTTDNNANLDFMDRQGEFPSRHFAFLVSEPEFDASFDRIKQRDLRSDQTTRTRLLGRSRAGEERRD